jgi:hypothetical protein
MGLAIRCFLGFSTTYSNEFSERLERRAAELDSGLRKAHAALLNGMSILHQAVDAASVRDAALMTFNLDRGLAELTESEEGVAGMIDVLASTRAELTHRASDSQDPLICRERFFSITDWAPVYQELEAHGAVLPQRVYWDDVVEVVQCGGTPSAIRLLETQLEALRADLGAYIREVNAMRSLPMQVLSFALHGTSLRVSGLITRFTQFLTSCLYLSLICEHAMRRFEQELAESAAA